MTGFLVTVSINLKTSEFLTYECFVIVILDMSISRPVYLPASCIFLRVKSVM